MQTKVTAERNTAKKTFSKGKNVVKTKDTENKARQGKQQKSQFHRKISRQLY